MLCLPTSRTFAFRRMTQTPSSRTTGKTRNSRNPAHSMSCATNIDWDRSPACPSRSVSSLRRRLFARATSDSRTLAPSSATRLSAADRSRSSSIPISSPRVPNACQGVWHPAATGQVHREQVEEGADRVAEVASALVRLLLDLQIGQEAEDGAEE